METGEAGENPSLKRQHTDNIISFSNANVQEVQTSHNNIIVIFMTTAKYDIKRILIDNESSVDILFYDVFHILFYDVFQKMNMLDLLK